MGRSDPAAQMTLIFRIIATKHFNERAQNRIAHKVSGEDLPIKFLAAIEPCQAGIQGEVQERFVNLRRMDGKRSVGWAHETLSTLLVPCIGLVRKLDGPG